MPLCSSIRRSLRWSSLGAWATILSAAAVLASCAGGSTEKQESVTKAAEPVTTPEPIPEAPAKLVYVKIGTTAGDIVVELDAERAPISTANFLMYARNGAYDGTIFHRVIEKFVIQGGGYTNELVERGALAKAAGTPDAPIRNEWGNGLKNERGTIAMARDPEPDSATREFYINVQDNPKLDIARDMTGKAGYAVFGKVVSGMEVVDAIRRAPTHDLVEKKMENVPVSPVVINSVREITAAEAGKPGGGR